MKTDNFLPCPEWGWSGYACDEAVMQRLLEKTISGYKPFCSIEYCTHCGRTIGANESRCMCSQCRSMTLQERMEAFPHII